MPSLFSRLKHRKSPSASSVVFSSPPASPLTAQSPGTAGSATSPTSPSQARLASNNGALVDRSVEDVVVVDRMDPATQARPRDFDSMGSRPAPPPPTADITGHSPAVADESERPDLPTTSLNVNNPIPASNRSSAGKGLPELPELPRDLSSPFSGFTLPPGAAPASPTPPPPMPHVASIDRSRLSESERERPRPVIAESQGLSEGYDRHVGGRFGNVQSITRTNDDRRSGETNRSRRSYDNTNGASRVAETERQRSTPVTVENQGPPNAQPFLNPNEGRRRDEVTRTLDTQDIPPRGISLAAKPPIASTGASRPSAPTTSTLSATPAGPRDLRSYWDPEIDGDEHISRHIANLTLNNSKRHDYEPKTTAALEAEREETAAGVLHGSRTEPGRVSDFGKQVFEAAGMGDKLGMLNTVDVRTQWMEPVVQETVRRTEHTDSLVYVDRDVHKYHIYPKIQPISDPDPIRMETRHRIFSQADGQWHEVIGDQAAIAILGEEAFYGGQKQTRDVRGMALPGLGESMSKMTEEELLVNGLGTGHGLGRVLEREGYLGGAMGQWREVGRTNGMVGGVKEGRQAVRESRVGVAL